VTCPNCNQPAQFIYATGCASPRCPGFKKPEQRAPKLTVEDFAGRRRTVTPSQFAKDLSAVS
jgi:hypothetical protein